MTLRIKLYISMNQVESEGEPKPSHLEQLFNRMKPKSRYISESHIDQETSSISKEIVNGDIEVRRVRGNLELPQEKNTYEQMIRRKYAQQFAKEKEELEHRLGYIENSLVHLDRLDFLKKRGSVDSSLGLSRKTEVWRKQHQQQMKRLEKKKREIAEKSKEKETETESLRAKIMEQEKNIKKSQLLESIKKVKERTEKRQEVAREEKQKVKELLSRKELFQKLQERFQEKEEGVLEERKKKLAEIRQLKPHINLQQILDHEQKVLDILKEKQLMRNRQLRMNSSRASSYRPSYQSAFYKQLSGPREEDLDENPKQKLQKMRQFSQQVKSKYVPEIDENKRKQMEDRLEHQIKSRVDRIQKQKELLEKPKIKGLQYLQLVKKMPKRKDDSSREGPKTDRIAYKNYLGNMSVDMGKPKPWASILTKGDNKVQTAELLRYESEKIEEKLKQKEVFDRVMKKKDDGSIDQEYYQMVKAKLDLLAKE